jgi:photosystem II stability/assembly factor-like uncharacterized protein
VSSSPTESRAVPGLCQRWQLTARPGVRIVLCLVALLVTGQAVRADPELPTRLTDHLYGVDMIDGDQGWAVGAFGTIAQTRDGGVTWRVQSSPTAEQLFDVAFADPQHGWIVGRSGTILHTDDGGQTWRAQASGTDHHLFSVAALSPLESWAIGDWGTLRHTRDGGTTWIAADFARDLILNDQAWPDARHGWVVGETGAIFSTRDGGVTWTEQKTGIAKTLFGVFFVDPLTGWSVGLDGLILHTRDGGATWLVQHGEPTVRALDQVGFRESAENPSLYSVALNGHAGYAVGDAGSVFVSADGGESWQRAPTPSAASLRWIRAVSVAPAGVGLLVGANGLTLRMAGDPPSLAPPHADAAAIAH